MRLTNPFYECPSFEKCSCNKCPLDVRYEEMVVLPGEEKCKAHKPTRQRIGEKYGLPLKGLTRSEFSGKQVWEGYSPQEREKKLEALVKARKSL